MTTEENIKRSRILYTTGNVALKIGRVLFGIVFVFSGFVKAIDPLGSTYRIEDYLHNFGGFFESMADYAFPFAIALSTLELLIGLSMIINVHIDLTNILALLFMLVMTPLTLYIAVKNPVTDCGCFGDALVISNWATFGKNLVLLAMVIFMVRYHYKYQPYFINKIQYLLFFVIIGAGVSLSLYSHRHLPMIDFLPYKVGVNIPQAMIVPDNAPSDEYVTTFIYEKGGVQKEFTLENYPKGDSTWVFVDQKTRLVSKGYKAPIHDFNIMNSQFDDVTEQVLYYPGQTYLLIAYDINETSQEGALKAEEVYKKAKATGIKFYALTASTDEDIQKFVDKTGITYPFWKADPTTLKTMIRANPGLMLLKKGTIMGKWNWRDFN